MPTKLEIAVKASIPIISCQSRDRANLMKTLKHYIKAPIEQIASKAKYTAGTVYLATDAQIDPDSMATLREQMVKAGAITLFVNSNLPDGMALNIGMLPVPRELIKEKLEPLCSTDKELNAVLASLGGVTLREAEEIALYSMAEYAKFHPATLAKTRNELFQPMKGLYPVSTQQEFYEPSEAIREYVKTERQFFLRETDWRLRPRGLMLDGPPGVGKSEAAKYIAAKFEVPLYRLDLATTQDKYVGNSAKYLQANLDMLDQQEPCIVLIDEVEKIFNSSSGGWVTDLLSMLLWWMQTHTTRVMVLATTNDIGAIPKEFYRPGRLDKVIQIPSLNMKDTLPFIKNVLKAFGNEDEVLAIRTAKELEKASNNKTSVPQATVHAATVAAIKRHKLTAKKKLVFKK